MPRGRPSIERPPKEIIPRGIPKGNRATIIRSIHGPPKGNIPKIRPKPDKSTAKKDPDFYTKNKKNHRTKTICITTTCNIYI